MEKRDYYEVLGLDKNATAELIKANYRKMAIKYHPDKNPGDPESENMFKEAAEAYEVLSDPNKKARYDRYGHQGLRGGQDYHTYQNMEDIFSSFGDIFGGGGSIFDSFFGGSNAGRGKRYSGEPGADIKIKLPLTLEEISEGVAKTLKVRRLVTCDTCHGTGAKSGGKKSCGTCNGHGEVRQVSRSVFGQFINVSICPTCSGTGQEITDRCTDCRGEGRIFGEDKIKIDIPAGVEEGNYIPLRGKGHVGKNGGASGDLMVIIEEKKHAHFVRDRNNIIYNLNITFPQAALGDNVEVPTLTGTDNVRIEPGTQNGTKLRIRDKGIPYLNSSGRGDQYVILHVSIPTKLSSKEKELIETLAELDNFSPSQLNNKEKDKNIFEKIKDAFV